MRKFRLLMTALLCLWPILPAYAVDVQKVVSPGGIEAWLVEDRSNPIISMSFALRGGSAVDPAEKSGLAEMVCNLLDEGAGDLGSRAFHEKLDDLAISLGFSAGEDAIYGHLKTLTENRETAFDLLRLSLTRPRFDATAVERVRAQSLAELSQQEQDPDAIAGRAFSRMMFPDHPYGRPSDGREDTVKTITAVDLKDWVAAHLGRDQLTVAVVGDIRPEVLGMALDQVFAGLPARAAPVAVPEVTPDAHGQRDVIRRQIPQSVVQFGSAGLKRDDLDWYAAYVMNYILGGGGFSSRLLTEVRVKRGLAYSVYSYLRPYDHGGLIFGGVASRNDRVAESLRLIGEEWRRMAEKGVTAAELANAKTYLNGSFPLQLDSTSSIARLLVTIQMDNLGIDYLQRRERLINAVTLDDVRRVAKRLLDAEHLAAVVVGDPKGM